MDIEDEAFAAWGKLERGAHGEAIRCHPLGDHMLDVAACFLAIADCSRVRQAMQCTAARPLSRQDIARLAVLVFLHDLGKANSGFQGRRWAPDVAPRGWPAPAGHGPEALLAFQVQGDDLLAGLPLEQIAEWGESAYTLLRASISHHGRPLAEPVGLDVRIWRPVPATINCPAYSPARILGELGQRIRQIFPQAFEPGAPVLPDAPAFTHLFAGLVQLADWLGSDTRFFPYSEPGEDRTQNAFIRARQAVHAIGLEVSKQREQLQNETLSFARAFGLPHPRPIQRLLGETGLGPLLILESETGSGKTEAALWRFATLFEAGAVDSLYFALPTRVAATQLYARVQDFVQRLWPAGAPVAVRALAGYESADGNDKVALPDFRVLWSDRPDDVAAPKRWAAESPKRFLAATIAVGTVDQALMAALPVRHAHLRHALLSRALLVVDEVHASDAYMSVLLEHLLCAHLATGGHALLLSATLGSRARTRYQAITQTANGGASHLHGRVPHAVPLPSLEQACALPYPALSDGFQIRAIEGGPAQKNVHWQTLPAIDDPARVAGLALDAAALGARVLVIRNTVPAAIATLRAVEARIHGDGEQAWLFKVAGVSTLHHSRFSRQDRPLLDAAVEAQIGKQRGQSGACIVIGTQTLEQSLDLDADLLITDICPMDVLLQRIGRLHRHARPPGERPDEFVQAQAWILTPADDRLEGYLQRPRNGLGRHRDGGGVYSDLRIVEATRRLITAQLCRGIPRENRELVERAMHPDCLRAIEMELGDAWARLGLTLEGDLGANRTLGNLHALPYDAPFDTLCFPDAGEKIATRLGAADRLVELDPALPGPFGAEVRQLAIRHHLIPPGLSPDESVSNIVTQPGGFEFSLEKARFRYSRFGLERVADTRTARGAV